MITIVTSVSTNKIKIENGEQSPEKPTINGPDHVCCNVMCEYSISSVDPQGNQIYYEIRCSDCPVIFTTDYYYSGETMAFEHCWDDFYQNTNPFRIRAKAIDNHGHESEWATFDVQVDLVEKNIQPFFYRFFQDCPLLLQFLTNLTNIIK